LEFNVHFQHKYNYIRDKKVTGGELFLHCEGPPVTY